MHSVHIEDARWWDIAFDKSRIWKSLICKSLILKSQVLLKSDLLG